MIQMQSNLDVADNSGVEARPVHQGAGWLASVGSQASATSSWCRSRKRSPRARVKKGDVHRAVIVRTKKDDVRRTDGFGHPLRQQCRRPRRQERRADRHAYLRPRRPRASRQGLHEDHLARSGGAVIGCREDQEGRHRRRSFGARTRAAPAPCSRSFRRMRRSSCRA